MSSTKAIHPARYRAGQFFIALKAYLPTWLGGLRSHLSTNDEILIKSVLSTLAQQQLFNRMTPNDQRHAMAVVHTLWQAGYNHSALMQAALLHDVGKSMGQPIIHRVLIVLFNAFWPAALKWLSASGQGSNDQLGDANSVITGEQSAVNSDQLSAIYLISWWRRPFVVHAQHPAIGAAWARQVGCDPLAVDLIFRHQDNLAGETTEEQEEELLAALQWADDLN
jgi:hypothetical protein